MLFTITKRLEAVATARRWQSYTPGCYRTKIRIVILFQKRRRLQRRACLQQGCCRYRLQIWTVAINPNGLLIIWTHFAQCLTMHWLRLASVPRTNKNVISKASFSKFIKFIFWLPLFSSNNLTLQQNCRYQILGWVVNDFTIFYALSNVIIMRKNIKIAGCILFWAVEELWSDCKALKDYETAFDVDRAFDFKPRRNRRRSRTFSRVFSNPCYFP